MAYHRPVFIARLSLSVDILLGTGPVRQSVHTL
jgi:hypothetical protein